MNEIDKLLNIAQSFCKKVAKFSYVIDLTADTKKINHQSIELFYYILNHFEDSYFIIIKNIPYCLMPDAGDHLLYSNDGHHVYRHDKICVKCDFKKKCPGWRSEFRFDRATMKPCKDVPNEIAIEATNQCNLNCRTCAVDRSNSLNLSLISFKKILGDCKKNGVTAVRFTGGEPLLNPHLKEMLSLAKQNNLYVILNTNATKIDDATHKVIARTVDNMLVSLQGHNQVSDSYLTGSNRIFTKKIRSIMKLRSLIPRLRIGTVISKTLLVHWNRYLALLKKMKVDHWELYRPITEIYDDEYSLSKKDLLRVMERIYALKEEGFKVRIANPVPFCISKDTNLSLSVLLGAIPEDGNSRLVRDIRGYYKPSYFMDISLGGTIEEAQRNDFLKDIKSLFFLADKCKKCSYLKWCRGGSRVISKIHSGSYFARDPLFSE